MPEYTLVASGVLAATVILAALRGVLQRHTVWIGLALFALLTVIADVVLTQAGVYHHGSAFNARLMLDRMPIEDLMYGIALYLVAVVAWSWNAIPRAISPINRVVERRSGGRLLSELIRASRPFSWINTVLPFIAVALSLQHRFTPALVLGAVYFSAPYNLLLYGVNDLYDFESDRHNPRKGGMIEGGLIPPRDARALWSAIALLTLPLLLLIGWLTPVAALAIALSSAVALAYSLPPLRLKEVPGFDALTASLAFVLPALTGAILAGASLWKFPWLYLFAFLVWGLASQALGAIQDVPYDRTAHIQSIAAWLGQRPTALLATGAYLVTVVLVASAGGPSLIAAAALLPYALISASCLLGDPSRWARRAWKAFLGLNLLSGFVITMVLLQTGAIALLSEAP